MCDDKMHRCIETYESIYKSNGHKMFATQIKNTEYIIRELKQTLMKSKKS